MQFQYFDIHSHLNLSPLSEKKAEILARMRELGVGTITVGTGIGTSRDAIRIADENPDMCYATVGVHPNDVTTSFALSDNEWAEIENLARNPCVVAIGETGLDYFRLPVGTSPELKVESEKLKGEQRKIFEKHIAIAASVGKPLMLHVRASKGTDDAYYDALEIIKNQESNTKNQIKANFHFFSGSKECMEKIVEAGFMISVDGPITFSHDYDDMIRACPIESIMAETDAPFACPEPYRTASRTAPTSDRGNPSTGLRAGTCEPWMVVEVVKKIAELKSLPLETVQKQLLENTSRFFDIPLSA